MAAGLRGLCARARPRPPPRRRGGRCSRRTAARSPVRRGAAERRRRAAAPGVVGSGGGGGDRCARLNAPIVQNVQKHNNKCSVSSCIKVLEGFGDILLIGILMDIKDSSWKGLCAMDDASDAQLFKLNELPPLAFYCHEKIVEFYLELRQDKL